MQLNEIFSSGSERYTTYPFVYGQPLMGTFTNSKDPHEMANNAVFHQCLHCLSR